MEAHRARRARASESAATSLLSPQSTFQIHGEAGPFRNVGYSSTLLHRHNIIGPGGPPSQHTARERQVWTVACVAALFESIASAAPLAAIPPSSLPIPSLAPFCTSGLASQHSARRHRPPSPIVAPKPIAAVAVSTQTYAVPDSAAVVPNPTLACPHRTIVAAAHPTLSRLLLASANTQPPPSTSAD